MSRPNHKHRTDILEMEDRTEVIHTQYPALDLSAWLPYRHLDHEYRRHTVRLFQDGAIDISIDIHLPGEPIHRRAFWLNAREELKFIVEMDISDDACRDVSNEFWHVVPSRELREEAYALLQEAKDALRIFEANRDGERYVPLPRDPRAGEPKFHGPTPPQRY